MPEFKTLRLELDEDVLTVTFDREHKANAMNSLMVRELIQLADWLRESTEEIKFVIFTNRGKTFSAGADLLELYDGLESGSFQNESTRVYQLYGQEMMSKLENLEQITIAALNGSAYGGGVVVALTSDFRLMTESSVFNLPETNVGMFLTWGCTPRLVKAVGTVKAKELIMLAEDLTAEECYRIGLINKVVPKDQLVDETNQLIHNLRRKGQQAIRLTKKLVNASFPANIGDVYINEPELFEKVIASGEIKEKIQPFFNSDK